MSVKVVPIAMRGSSSVTFTVMAWRTYPENSSRVLCLSACPIPALAVCLLISLRQVGLGSLIVIRNDHVNIAATHLAS